MSWWTNDPVAPAAQQGMPAPIIDLRDPSKAAGDARDEVRTDIAVRGEQIGNDKTTFDQKGALYERYNKLPEVKNYRVAVQQLSQAIGTGEGPQADLALTYAFAKAMDPESVVRESEQGMVTSSQPWFLSQVEATKKQFGMDGAGNYTPETRKQLRLQIANAVGQRNKLYNTQRDYFTEMAKRNEFDPYEIVGEHDANPFAEKIRTWGKGENVATPDMTGGLPTGTDVTFNGNDNAFDRAAWLQKTHGMDVDTEARLMAGLNANSGKALDYDQLLQIHENAGAPPPRIDEAKRIIDGLASGKVEFGPYDDSAARQEIADQMKALVAEKDTATGAIESGVEGVARGVTLGGLDELGAAANTLIDGGTYDENLQRERMMRDAYREANPIASYAGEFVGSAVLPLGIARTPAELAKVGAKVGAGYGFLSSDGDVVDRLANSGLSASVGAGGGYAMGKGFELAAPTVSRLMTRAPRAPNEMSAPDFIAAAQRQDVDYLPADIPGSYGTQMATSITDKTFGSKFIQDGAKKSVDSVQNAVRRTTDSLGGAAEDVVPAGQAAQRGVNAWQESADKKIGELYDNIPIAGDSAAETTNTLAALREVNNPISSNPALSAEISDPKLKAYQEALEGGGLSWQDLKGFRTYVGGKLGAPSLQSDIPKDRLKALYSGLSSDLEATATAQGPAALSAFKRANTYKRAVETRRENVMGLLLGKKLDMTPEKTFAQIQSWAKATGGDFAKLSQAVRSLPVDEANAVRATIIDTLGKSTAGAQNATGTAFSPSTFATQWNKLSPRAKAVLFQGDHRAALDDIAGLSVSMKRADLYNNNSNTGVVVGGAATAASFMGSPLLTTGVIGGQLLSGAVLGSPRVAKWVAALYRKPNQPSVLAHIARLENIAKAEPAIASDLLQLQERLFVAANDNPMKLAADEETPQSKAKTKTIEALQ